VVFTIHCTFAPGAFAHAKRLRMEHYAFLREVRGSIVEGGPLVGPDGVPVGMLMVVEGADERAARELIAREPYNANGFFESVAVRRWAHVIPEPHAGYIEGEYEKERALRAK
jgi:uncharacterized protein YciI